MLVLAVTATIHWLARIEPSVTERSAFAAGARASCQSTPDVGAISDTCGRRDLRHPQNDGAPRKWRFFHGGYGDQGRRRHPGAAARQVDIRASADEHSKCTCCPFRWRDIGASSREPSRRCASSRRVCECDRPSSACHRHRPTAIVESPPACGAMQRIDPADTQGGSRRVVIAARTGGIRSRGYRTSPASSMAHTTPAARY